MQLDGHKFIGVDTRNAIGLHSMYVRRLRYVKIVSRSTMSFPPAMGKFLCERLADDVGYLLRRDEALASLQHLFELLLLL